MFCQCDEVLSRLWIVRYSLLSHEFHTEIRFLKIIFCFFDFRNNRFRNGCFATANIAYFSVMMLFSFILSVKVLQVACRLVRRQIAEIFIIGISWKSKILSMNVNFLWTFPCFLILYNQQSSQTFRNLQQSANAKLVVVSLQCRKEQGGTDIKTTAGRRKWT